MQVEIVTIGDELLLGFTIDTNAAHLARALAAVGIRVARRATVGDDSGEIADAVAAALQRTGAVITTGGLGPTSDDATKPALAALFGREMHLDVAVLSGIEERFRRLGFPGSMPHSNRQQAMIPAGADVIPNAHGSAPGIWLEDQQGRWVAMLPGVPREMRGMLTDELLPRLMARSGGASSVILSRTLRTTGVGESALADKLGNEARAVNGIPLAYLPGWEGADLRLTLADADAEQGTHRLAEAAERLLGVVGEDVYGGDGDDLAAVTLQRCRDAGATIAAAESCTGGLLGGRLTAIPGSSDVYLGGVITYDDRVKSSLLGVEPLLLAAHGAVSEAVARAMAVGVRERLGSTIGIGITGIAGPGGGTPEKPVGLVWIAVSIGDSEKVSGRIYVGDREEIRLRATQAALDMTRRLLGGGRSAAIAGPPVAPTTSERRD